MKAVVDRIVQYANRYQLTDVETGEVLGTFDFEEVTGTVQQVGTEIDKELFDSIANDLATRVKLSGGELAGTIVTFSDISGTAANVASGDTSATLWGKVKNWFSRLKALAFKNKVAAGDFEAGAIKNADVAADAAIAQSKVSGLMTDYVASISVSGRTVTYQNKNGVNMGSITTQDTTYELASQSSNGLMSSTDKTKLDGIESGAQKNTVLGVKGSSESAYRTGNVNITKANIGLGNVDNTSDEDKPVSTATQTALNGKANTSGTYPNLTVGKATNADNTTKATQDASGNVITSTYATKKELNSGLSGKANTSGSYPNLTVGNAEKLGNKAASEYALKLDIKTRIYSTKTRGSPYKWESKTWNGFTSFNDYNANIWTDGTDIYYSYGTNQYVLNRETSTWRSKTWSGLTMFDGYNIWTDGENIYYSTYGVSGTTQYVLNRETSTWESKTWSGLTELTPLYGRYIWADGENIYHSNGGSQLVLNCETSTWESKTWNGLDSFIGANIWTDGTDIYYSYGTNQYVLNRETSTWEPKSWNGLTSFYGSSIWTDGENIYHSNDTNQYVLNRRTSTWEPKSWNGLTSFYGMYIWTDGSDIYYSRFNRGIAEHYVLTELIKSTKPILNHQ